MRLSFRWLPPLLLPWLVGCGAAPAGLEGPAEPVLPQPPGIRVAFNHREGARYRSPVSGRWRQGDDLEAMVVEAIGQARQEILVAVQELSLAGVAEALVERHRRGVAVRVVLENTYSTPWSRQHPADLTPTSASGSPSCGPWPRPMRWPSCCRRASP